MTHDLTAIALAEELLLPKDLLTHGDVSRLKVIWGADVRVDRPVQKIRLGTYSLHSQTIRIHPRLDDERVPAWVIGFIVYHEYLHHLVDIKHTPRFRIAERRHPNFARASAWERAHIGSLLSAAWSITSRGHDGTASSSVP